MKTAVRRAVFPASRHVISRAIGAALSATASFCAPLAAHAADMNAVNNAAKMASSVGAGTAVPALGVGAVLQTIVGLVVVIGLVFGCAWLARRFGLQPGSRSGLVKTIGGASLGGKERVAVVEIGDTWLVLGAAPGNVRLLHTMPAGSVAVDAIGNTQAGTPGATGSSSAAGSTGLPGSFGQRFRDALKGEVSKRFNGQGNGVR
ncbi:MULTISPECIES: flagellar biosynthetic protein FliO [Paraburkholderia]|jgi:flagellar protein FliO/FliZ|uniref:Flagellar protein n=1 Tax=Paraburkholderia caledonica TaxID=134536 RepID=A0AB73I714_9BURK|nr:MULTISPECIES: flagellar biosynthetic protein FliO [Paraburkholderia]OWJ57465.1 flagellar biosynthetic protein FliO [Burkholderia sp. Bk]MDP9645769.1 flagellar protein FliO/FliZ [Paraburkholderia caledonica]MDR7006960.1 flagellar protein FliO/FliZ [Paraburkholderia strydomiana]CAH2899958.1 MAG: Flagellar biosynthesis protein FliO [uncultured Paraburkholderia sp.]CAH2932451.1 MAG: Flagellar biosynthesis protein FliO [uncultured Paraburkholderia sp.]